VSMENGFELDFPGDDDNADRYGSRAEISGTDGDIPEPDFASIDEMPRVITKVENMELVLTSGFDCDFGCMPMDHGITRQELERQESLAYHRMSLARTQYEQAHAEYVRIGDRLNDLKIRESREPK